MIFRFTLFLCCTLFSTVFTTAASYRFHYSEQCHVAYQEYMSLRIEGGRRAIRQEIIQDPRNLMATYIADYEDCLVLLFNGSKQEYAQRKHHMDQRLDLIENGDEQDPWYRFCKSGIYFHWALIQFRFGENLKAANTFRKSYQLIKENLDLFPDFLQNYIFLGMQEAVVGTIPDEYKWLASIFGMKGNIRKGMEKMAYFLNKTTENEPLREEAVLYYYYLRFYLISDQESVWKYISSNRFPCENNLMRSFVKANLALNYRKGAAALHTMKEASRLSEYRDFPIMDYQLGRAQLLQLLTAEAIQTLESFLKKYQGRIFVKDALQNITLGYYLLNQPTEAARYRTRITKEGTASTDADKQAKRFAESETWPAIPVLQARLLIDGGYYKEALEKLQNCPASSLKAATDNLEYHFRTGRAYDELRNDAQAIRYYQTTIDMGKSRKEHYAARSALQMARIYERNGQKEAAMTRYKECLSMKGHDFQANIDQQAKAGLDRLLK